MNQRNNASTNARMVMWVMWIAFAASVFYYPILLLHGPRSKISLPKDPTSILLYAIPVIITISMRWLVIPKCRNLSVTFVPFLIGIAAAETLTFFGIFILPPHFTLFYITTWVLMLMLLPLWKTR